MIASECSISGDVLRLGLWVGHVSYWHYLWLMFVSGVRYIYDQDHCRKYYTTPYDLKIAPQPQ